MMTAKEFSKYLDRDGARCYHCGTTEGLVPQHRVGRGMGGSKLLNMPSNVITFCSIQNGLLESSGPAADEARAMGWKLQRWEADYLLVRPVYDRASNSWFFLNDSYGRTVA
ncbi:MULTISPECIES: hypothetical protein [Arthrobacter]|uniref:HNH endonuclease n=1 Tax=Arthrobacter terricola TaxID=2547396 RepID=A0A4V2ZTF3_9MICC|nr:MULTISPECIES: hypothetical protein [Arthrobacter]MBT8161033.1 hypothetical protein [Arthrobacter sp. GN70]TDF96894.1 hypothetical protein E1809_09235 [Arthrobacter terricola]